MAGLIPARGNWEYRLTNQASAATFFKGDALALNGVREAVRFASTSSQLHGIAMQDSANSLPRGKVIVAIPAPNCTAYADVDVGIAASALSIGQGKSLYKSGATNTSYISQLAGSQFSTVCVVAGPLDSALSRIEVAFLTSGGLYSASTSTYLT